MKKVFEGEYKEGIISSVEKWLEKNLPEYTKNCDVVIVEILRANDQN